MPVATAKVIGRRRQPIRIWSSREHFFTELAIFLLGAAGVYSISLVGQLPGNEILLFPLLPVIMLAHGRRAFRREYLWFYVLVIGWFFATIVGDLYLGSPRANSIKGAARVIFFTMNFIALAILINNSTRRMIIFLLSIFVQMFQNMLLFRGDFLTQWKFGGSSIVTITALLISSHFYSRRKYWICFFIVVSVAGLNLVFAFRSQIATDFISAVLILPIFAKARTLGSRKSPFRNLLKVGSLLALAAGAAFLANRAIQFAADKGFFDESITAKFKTQAEGKFGVLVGGRPETLVAIQAIRDSPIIGHGSFAVDAKYLKLKQDIEYENGYSDTDSPEELEVDTIPTHSHLTSAWVESGVFGGIFWIYVLVLTSRAIMRVSFDRPSLAPIYSYLMLNFVWNVLYSPFGSVNRMWAAFFILMGYKLVKPHVQQTSAARQGNVQFPVRLRGPIPARIGLRG